jgi:hypothetical protein
VTTTPTASGEMSAAASAATGVAPATTPASATTTVAAGCACDERHSSREHSRRQDPKGLRQ